MRASVVIPSYNAASTLIETLDSIIPQLTALDEVIIVDDGSTDQTQTVIQPYLSDNIRYFHQPNSGGPAAPRNKGIAEARGKYIFLFDSDDLMLPGKIERSVQALEKYPEAGILFTNFQTIDENAAPLRQRFVDSYTFIKKLKKSRTGKIHRIEMLDAWEHLASENFIGTSSVAIPATTLKQVGGFDESLKNGDDRDMWFQITHGFTAIFLDYELHQYRIHCGSISKGNAAKRAVSKIRVLQKQLNAPVTAKFKKNIYRLLSENYHDLAYDALNREDMACARKYAAKAVYHEATRKNIILIGKILLGKQLIYAFRFLKKITLK